MDKCCTHQSNSLRNVPHVVKMQEKKKVCKALKLQKRSIYTL